MRIALVLVLLTLVVGALAVDWRVFTGNVVPAADSLAMADPTSQSPTIVDGRDVETGLIAGEGMELVKNNCTGCHSARLITQNRLSRERWEKTIRWMQKNQNLADLGDNEPIILDYLAKYYGPVASGRRKPLEKQNWYELK